MTGNHLPTFFFRSVDAIGPVAAMDPAALTRRLHSILVTLIVPDFPATHDVPDAEVEDVRGPSTPQDRAPALPEHVVMAISLLARVYPRLHLVGADPEPLRQLAAGINPAADLSVGRLAEPATWQRAVDGPPGVSESEPIPGVTRQISLIIGSDSGLAPMRSDPADVIHVGAHGWNVAVDGYGVEAASPPGVALAWLAAACIGVAEVFRTVFADELGARGRKGLQPGGFNLVTGHDRSDVQDDLRAHTFSATLIGAGAVGQAAVLALRASGASGRLSVLDPEVLDLSNCQRYVLSTAGDAGVAKVSLVQRALVDSEVEVLPIQQRWGAVAVSPFVRTTLMVGLDTAADRIAVAACMPPTSYNAWTQPDDLGWSRHEQLGRTPCIACLYYPDRSRPGEHELIAQALDVHPLRVLGYLTDRLPVGVPLLTVLDVAGLPAPDEASNWVQRSLIDDLAGAGRVSQDEADSFRDRPLGTLYREGVCGGGLLNLGPAAGDREAMVPLAHQSALAGVMLTVSMLIAHDPRLAAQRPDNIEARFDVLRGFPQQLPRPRARTPGCLCSDPDYLALIDEAASSEAT